MKVKVSELIGLALDWAVAYIHEPEHTRSQIVYLPFLVEDQRYSSDWSQGGPIIERERIIWDFYDTHPANNHDAVHARLNRMKKHPTKTTDWYAEKSGESPFSCRHALLCSVKVGRRHRNPLRTSPVVLDTTPLA